MVAFDTAWDLIKMPIVPGSLERVEGPLKDSDIMPHEYRHLEAQTNYPIGVWNAKFEHPDTGEIHPMQLRALLSRKYLDPDFIPSFSGNIGYDMSQVRAHNQIYTDPEERKFVITSAVTDKPHRRKGMATALYDMIARVLADSDARLMRTGDTQTPAAKSLWGDRTEWPVRDDL